MKCKINTSFPNPTSMPKAILPRISIQMNSTVVLSAALSKKKDDATKIVSFQPYFVHIFDSRKLETRVIRYNEDVKLKM